MMKLRGRARRGGFTLIEVSLALIVFLMMTLMFAAVFPMTIRASRMSNNYANAALIAQHKIDELRGIGYDGLDPTNGGNKISNLPSLGYTDTISTTPTSLPYTLYFTNADHLVAGGTSKGYFPVGTVGQITVKDYSTVDATMSGASGNVEMVTVSITWPGIGAQAGGSYTASMLLVSQHND